MVRPRHDTRAFLQRHSGHPGIVAATGWLQRSIDTGFIPEGFGPYSPPPVAILELWNRLRIRGVTGEEVFAELAAMTLLQHRHSSRFHDAAEFQTQLAGKVLRLRFREGAFKPQHRVTGRAARRHLGEVVLLNLGVILQRVAEQIEREIDSPPIAQLPGLDVAFDVTQYGAGPLQ
jgi:hypothetical protein